MYFFRSNEYNSISFEDILYVIKNFDNDRDGHPTSPPDLLRTLIINTLPINEQSYLIQHTTSYDREEDIINESLQTCQNRIIIYGKNAMDKTMEKKYSQLLTLGYLEMNLYIYYGGLFEWSLLRDIYGEDAFRTIGKSTDPLEYKPSVTLFPTN